MKRALPLLLLLLLLLSARCLRLVHIVETIVEQRGSDEITRQTFADSAGIEPGPFGEPYGLGIVEQLDPNFDPRSFRLGDLQLGDLQVHVPSGVGSFQGDFDFTKSKGFILRVSAGIDITSNVITWLLQAIDPLTGEPDIDILRELVDDRTRAVVYTHLFGARGDVTPVLALAHERGALLVEDCAEAYAGPSWRGHGQSDLVLFSFGPIKTATAFGGGLACVRDSTTREEMLRLAVVMPRQPRVEYLRRLMKFGVLAAATDPRAFAVLVRLLDLMGHTAGELRRVALLYPPARPVQWKLMGDLRTSIAPPVQSMAGPLRKLYWEEKSIAATVASRCCCIVGSGCARSSSPTASPRPGCSSVRAPSSPCAAS